MELKTYLEILVRRWRVASIVAFVVICLAALGSHFVRPKYQAETLLRVVTPLGGSSSNTNYQTTFATRLINTYAQIAISERINDELKQKLGLQVLPDISVKVISDSEIIQVVVQSENPALAVKTANTLADVLVSYQDNAVKSLDQNAQNILTNRKNELQAELTQYQQQHDQLVQAYSQSTADMAVLDRKIGIQEASYENLQNQYEQTVLEGRKASQVLLAEIERVGKEVDSLNQQYTDLSTKSNQYLQGITLIRQTIQSTQTAYSNLLSQYNDVLLANSMQEKAQTIEIASSATEPTNPTGPNSQVVLGVGVLCGLIAGIIAAFLVENLDTRLFSFVQIEAVTTSPIVGSISNFKHEPSVTHPDEHDPIVERDFWMFSAKILTLVKEKSIKSVMITSPNPLEGKSTIVYELALDMARNNSKILVVDANLRNPIQDKLFNADGEHGLSDYLGSEVKDLKKVILKNIKPGIDLLPCFANSEDPIDLLRTQNLNTLFDAVQSYDAILFDTPALLTFPDALDLAEAVDGVIIVTKWGYTSSSDIESICHDVESVGSNVLGIVMNQIPRKRKNFFLTMNSRLLQQHFGSLK